MLLLLFLFVTVLSAASAPTNGMGCSICKLGEVEKLLAKGETEKEIQKVLDKFCDDIPVGKSLCKTVVDEYLPKIIDLLEKKFPPETVCKDITLCTSPSLAEAPRPIGGIECTICTFVVGEVEKFIAQGKTVDEIEKLVDEACKLLPIGKSACENLVHEYLPKIIQMLEEKFPADVICKDLTLCPKSANSAAPAPRKNGLGCTICGWVVSYAEQLLAKNETEAEIMKALDKFCKDLPVGQSICTGFVNEYFPKIIEYLEQSYSPDKVCQLLGLCTSNMARGTGNGLGCTICGWVVSYAEKLLAKNETEAELEKALDDFCKDLPVGQSICTGFVNEYLPKIIEYLEQSYTPDEVCKMLGLCSSNVAKQASNGLGCTICGWVVSYAEQLLAKNETEAEIMKALDKFCKDLPVGQSICTGFVNEYLPKIISYLEQSYSPDKVCQLLGLCTSSMTQKKRKKRNPVGECAMCTLVVGKVKDMLKNNKTEQEIEDELNSLCDKLNGTYTATCKMLVDVALPQVFKYVDSTPAKAICQKIGMCKKRRKRRF